MINVDFIHLALCACANASVMSRMCMGIKCKTWTAVWCRLLMVQLCCGDTTSGTSIVVTRIGFVESLQMAFLCYIWRVLGDFFSLVFWKIFSLVFLCFPKTLLLFIIFQILEFPMPSSKKKDGYLTYQGTPKVPVSTNPNVWPHCEVLKDLFCPTVIELTTRATTSFEGDGEAYQTLFEDNSEGDDIFSSPWSLLRMCVEKAEAAWSAICIESRSQSSQSYDARVRKVMAVSGNSHKLLSVGIKKALGCSRIHSVTRGIWSFESRGGARRAKCPLPWGESSIHPSRMSWTSHHYLCRGRPMQ